MSPSQEKDPDQSPPPPPGLFYESHRKAAEGIQFTYNGWTSKLTDSSLTLSIAVVGANWAVYGNVDALTSNCLALISVLLVFLTIAFNLLGALVMSECLGSRMRFAESDVERWKEQFDGHTGNNQDDPWPFTGFILGLARVLRWIKAGLPTLAGALFLISLYFREAAKPATTPPNCGCKCALAKPEEQARSGDEKPVMNPASPKPGGKK